MQSTSSSCARQARHKQAFHKQARHKRGPMQHADTCCTTQFHQPYHRKLFGIEYRSLWSQFIALPCWPQPHSFTSRIIRCLVTLQELNARSRHAWFKSIHQHSKCHLQESSHAHAKRRLHSQGKALCIQRTRMDGAVGTSTRLVETQT